MPLSQSRHAPLTSIATSAIDSHADLASPYVEDDQGRSTPKPQNGNPIWPHNKRAQSPASPYSPGLRSSLVLQRTNSAGELNPFDGVQSGEIQMQNFQEGLPPPPPVSHSWKRIDAWAEQNYEELWDQLSEGATQNDVNDLEHELDCQLPLEVRESLMIHDGQERGGRPTGIIFGCMLLDCEEIVQEWRNWKVVNEEYLSRPNSRQSLPMMPKAFAGSSSSAPAPNNQTPNPLWRQELLDRQDSQPPRAIQRAYAHSSWIPLARDWGGNNIAVDLAPGPQGKWGQVIIFGRDYDCKYVIARSWASFLATVADDMSTEKVFVDEETQELKLREFRQRGVEPAYLDILRWRMDQKYGRKPPPRRRPPPGNGPPPSGAGGNGGPHGSAGSSPRGSPYGSPTDERGRSPQRFSGVTGRGAHNSFAQNSPRMNPVRPSPLAQVSEIAAPKPIYSGSRQNLLDTANGSVPGTPLDSKLVDLGTPIEKSTFGLGLARVDTADSNNGKEKRGSLSGSGLSSESNAVGGANENAVDGLDAFAGKEVPESNEKGRTSDEQPQQHKRMSAASLKRSSKDVSSTAPPSSNHNTMVNGVNGTNTDPIGEMKEVKL